MTDLLIKLSPPTFVGSPPLQSPSPLMTASATPGPRKPPSAAADVVFRAPGGAGQLYRATEMRHSRSEDLLGGGSGSGSSNGGGSSIVGLVGGHRQRGGLVGGSPPPTPPPPGLVAAAASEDDLVAASALSEGCGNGGGVGGAAGLMLGHRAPGSPGLLADRLDPEDSIRDIVTENDLYRFVLFKRHYDKYMALAARYEEARGLAYYLEERYHEVKAERDKLEETRQQLEKRLEGCEAELKDKEEELFLQLERSLRLEDEVERARQEREACVLARERLEREQAAALRQLQIQAAQNEVTRRTLERARQEVMRHATVIKSERDALERENEALKEKLRAEQDELGAERRRNEEGVAALTHEAATLRHAARHLRAAALHATSCRRRRRCSVCLYARRTFQDVDDYRNDGKLFKCLQAPLQDLRTWLRPSTPAVVALPPLRTSSPLDRGGIGYIDDSGTSSGEEDEEEEDEVEDDDEAYSNAPANEVSLSSTASSAPPTARAFSSDSGFSSETGDRRSRSYECGGSSRKISESSVSEAGDATSTGGTHHRQQHQQQQQHKGTGITRSRWTSSFRRLLGRKPKIAAKSGQQQQQQQDEGAVVADATNTSTTTMTRRST